MSTAEPATPTAVPTLPDAWRQGPPAGAVPDTSACAGCAPTRFVPGGLGRVEVAGPETAAEVLVPLVGFRDRERCVAAFLDTKHRLLGTATVSIGSIDHTFMAPREVFRDALLANASALVLAHNHPSGDPEPSRDDELVTRRLARAGEMLGVDLLDHLVVGGTTWTSLARRGVVT
ncbi:MAG: JAB domain-containing protein [Egicoccus sp.]